MVRVTGSSPASRAASGPSPVRAASISNVLTAAVPATPPPSVGVPATVGRQRQRDVCRFARDDVCRLRTVTGRVHVAHVRLGVGVGGDGTGGSGLDPRRLRQLRPRGDARADECHLHRDALVAGHDGLDRVVSRELRDLAVEIHRDVLLAQMLEHPLCGLVPERGKHAVATLEQMHLEPVPPADDTDRAGTVLEELTRRTAVWLLQVALGASTGDVLAQLLAVGHRAERVDSLALESVDGWLDRRCARGDQQVVVRLDHGIVSTGRDGPVVGVDTDHLVAGPQVDIPLLAELLGRDGDEILERLNLTLDVVGQPTGAVGHPRALLEHDHLEVGIVSLCLARGRHAGGVSADHDERLHVPA